MKQFFSNVSLIIRGIISYAIYRLSGKRIITKTGAACKQYTYEKNRDFIQRKQAELDSEHLNLRGWCKSTLDRKVTEDLERDNRLREAILEGRKQYRESFK